MSEGNDYKALYEQLQKETNEKLRKQDHTVNNSYYPPYH